MKGLFAYEFSQWNDTDRVFAAQDLCLHQLIERQARRTPDRTALVFEGNRLTYAELDRRAERLAARLRELGAKPETLVALYAERSHEAVAGILAILKAGAAYLPIDPAYPRERVAFMLADAGVGVLLTQRDLGDGVAPPSLPRVDLDGFDWNGAASPADGAPHVQSGNLAYVIYTSGSTGRPKGVGIEHGSIVNYVLGIAERLSLQPGMHHAIVSTLAADLGNTVLFPALATGGCLHVIAQERAESAALLAEYFAREPIDVLKIVPSHLAALQAGASPERVMPRQRLILGGEPSRTPDVERLRRLAPGCEIYNHYGPTEATVGALTYRVGEQLEATRSGTLPLGKPLPNYRAYIVNAAGESVSVGETGELLIAGAGVARGYLRRDDLTAQKFAADPFREEPGARIYRSGDRARYLPDGNIEFCGRVDHQVKVNGYRVELGEIEAALREHPGIQETVVMAREESAGRPQLVAYVVPQRADQPLWEHKAVHVLPDGSPVAHLNRNETDYIYNEIFVLQAYLRHGIAIRDGDCIIDAGANIGLFTVFASRVARDLRILSFEPNPAAHACLSANAQAWGSGVNCLPVGLSRSDGKADLTFFEGLSLLSGFYADAAKERSVVETYVRNQQATPEAAVSAEIGELIDERLKARTVSAELRTLSGIIAEHRLERIDLLKINVEKSELDVLLGLGAGDWPKIAQLVIEVDQDANLQPITSLLEARGYDVLVEQDPLLRKTELCYVYAIRRDDPSRRLTPEPADTQRRSPPPAERQVLARAALKLRLKARLPHYMIPHAFVLLEKLPLSTNGKIDRAALPAAAPEGAMPAPVARTATATEKALAEIWRTVLGIDHVGPDDDFFDLGGQSLLAIQTMARVRETFRVDVPLRNLFERPTLAGLAATIDTLAWASTAASAPAAADEREEIAL